MTGLLTTAPVAASTQALYDATGDVGMRTVVVPGRYRAATGPATDDDV